MGNISDPAFLSALSGVLLAVLQLLRIVIALRRGEPLPPPEAVDTPLPTGGPNVPARAS